MANLVALVYNWWHLYARLHDGAHHRVVGAVAGGMLGAAAEEGLTRTQGVDITVREDDGSLRAYVQEVEPNQVFRVGERVRIMTINGTSRVTK